MTTTIKTTITRISRIMVSAETLQKILHEHYYRLGVFPQDTRLQIWDEYREVNTVPPVLIEWETTEAVTEGLANG